MHLAQVVELAVKAALVEHNISIYSKKDETRTLSSHEAQEQLATVWGKGPLPMRARIGLLIDERNAIQHRYGNVDELTFDYHMETVIEFLRALMKEDFDTDLDAMVRGVLPNISRSVRFIKSDEPTKEPSASVDAARPQLALLSGFTSFEKALRDRTRAVAPEANVRSILDLAMKFLGNVPGVPPALLKSFPDVVRLRNSVVHGVLEPSAEEVRQALSVLDEALAVLNKPEHDNTLRLAAEAHQQGRRGLASYKVGDKCEAPRARMIVQDVDGRFYAVQGDGGMWVTPMNTDTNPPQFGPLAWSDGGLMNFLDIGGIQRGPFTVVHLLRGTETKDDLDKLVATLRTPG